MEPAVRALARRRLAVQCIEANPISPVMCISNQIRETLFLLGCPYARGRLSSWFDNAPWIVPPSVIVIGRLGDQACRCSRRVIVVCPRCAENQERSAYTHLVVKYFLLNVRFTSKDKERLHVQWCHHANILRARCSRDPILIFP